MRTRFKRTAALFVLAALGLGAGCGEDEGTLTPVEVTRLEASLEEVRRSVAAGDRDGAFAALRQLRGDAEALDDSGASAQLREDLLTGIQRTKESLAKELPK